MKLILILYFILLKSYKILSFWHVVSIKINELFYILFHTKSLKSNVYFIFITYLNSDTKFSSEIPDLVLDLMNSPVEKNSFSHLRELLQTDLKVFDNWTKNLFLNLNLVFYFILKKSSKIYNTVSQLH